MTLRGKRERSRCGRREPARERTAEASSPERCLLPLLYISIHLSESAPPPSGSSRDTTRAGQLGGASIASRSRVWDETRRTRRAFRFARARSTRPRAHCRRDQSTVLTCDCLPQPDGLPNPLRVPVPCLLPLRLRSVRCRLA